VDKNPYHAAALILLLAIPGTCEIDDSKLLDLTHSFDNKTVYWPTAKPFTWHREAWGKAPGGYWYASASFEASEHLGTHMDSPIHFAERGATTDTVPLRQLVGPAAVIDISNATAKDANYELLPADVEAWERDNGRIPGGAIVLVRTGWSKFWPDRARYMGSAVDGDVTRLRFPGISPAAAKVLVARRVDGVGIDTASLDHGPSKDFQTHRILNGAGVYGLENVANMDRIPPTGATVVALPMKIRNGTGGPVRIMAILP
jgi:kynurenine formamidase